MKKTLSVLLALVFALSLGTVAFAAEDAATATDTTTAAPTTTKEVDFWDSFFSEMDGLLGYVVDADVDSIVDALEKALKDMGVDSLLDLDTSKVAEWADNAAAALEGMGVPKSKTLEWLQGVLDDLGIKGLYSYAPAPAPSENPETGSSAGIAVFAVLSVAAAAAFVCTKKKD